MKKIRTLFLLTLCISCKHSVTLPDYSLDFCSVPIYCAGNSLTSENGPGYLAYPTYLALIMGRDPATIFNGGEGGNTSTQIADRYISRTTFLSGAVIIEAGSNNNWWSEVIKADIRRIIASNGTDKYLILDVATGNLPERWPGTDYYAHNEQLNNEMEAEFGSMHFLRIKPYLQQHMDGSKQDSIDVFVNDCEPSSLHNDFIHRNNLGNYWTAQAIAERIAILCKNSGI